jgi:hypothetical protein
MWPHAHASCIKGNSVLLNVVGPAHQRCSQRMCLHLPPALQVPALPAGLQVSEPAELVCPAHLGVPRPASRRSPQAATPLQLARYRARNCPCLLPATPGGALLSAPPLPLPRPVPGTCMQTYTSQVKRSVNNLRRCSMCTNTYCHVVCSAHGHCTAYPRTAQWAVTYLLLAVPPHHLYTSPGGCQEGLPPQHACRGSGAARTVPVRDKLSPVCAAPPMGPTSLNLLRGLTCVCHCPDGVTTKTDTAQTSTGGSKTITLKKTVRQRCSQPVHCC